MVNKILHMFTLAAALCFCLVCRGQSNGFTGTHVQYIPPAQGEYSVFSSITKYLAAGDEVALSSWFADNLDITVISTTRNCSKKQAREILKGFFNANTPRSFTVTHKASEKGKKYLIGQLNAGGELFEVTIYATSSGQEPYKIQQLGIARQTGAY